MTDILILNNVVNKQTKGSQAYTAALLVTPLTPNHSQETVYYAPCGEPISEEKRKILPNMA